MSCPNLSRILMPGLLLWAVIFGGCQKKPAGSPAQGAPILKVAVFSDGRLTVDGVSSSLASLHDALRRLAAERGVVWYYRQAAQDEPPAIALQVMRELADSQVPLRLSSRPDYSDSLSASPPPQAAP